MNAGELQQLNAHAQALFKQNKELQTNCGKAGALDHGLLDDAQSLASSKQSDCPSVSSSYALEEYDKMQTKPQKFAKQRRNLNVEAPILFTPQVSTLARLPEFTSHEKYRDIFSKRYDLVFAMPTFPRLDESGKPRDYLRQTVLSLLSEYNSFAQLDPEAAKKFNILIYVQSYVGLEHTVFDDLQKELSTNDKVVLHKSPLRFYDPFDDIPGHDYTAFDNARPGPVARQQNCDVVSMTEHVMRNFDFEYFVFMEDDYV